MSVLLSIRLSMHPFTHPLFYPFFYLLVYFFTDRFISLFIYYSIQYCSKTFIYTKFTRNCTYLFIFYWSITSCSFPFIHILIFPPIYWSIYQYILFYILIFPRNKIIILDVRTLILKKTQYILHLATPKHKSFLLGPKLIQFSFLHFPVVTYPKLRMRLIPTHSESQTGYYLQDLPVNFSTHLIFLLCKNSWIEHILKPGFPD